MAASARPRHAGGAATDKGVELPGGAIAARPAPPDTWYRVRPRFDPGTPPSTTEIFAVRPDELSLLRSHPDGAALLAEYESPTRE